MAKFRKSILIALCSLWNVAYSHEILRVSLTKNNVITDQSASADISGTRLQLQAGDNEISFSARQGYIMIYQGNLPVRFMCWQSSAFFAFEQKRLLAVQTGIWSGGCVYLHPTSAAIELRSFFHGSTDHNKDHYLVIETPYYRESADQRVLRHTFTEGEEEHLGQADSITDRFGKTYAYPLENLPSGVYFLRKGMKIIVYRKIR